MAVGTGGGGSIGTVFVELDLDPKRYTRSQQRLYKDATQTALNIEANFKKLGIKSAAEFDLMRAKITNAYNMIAHSSKATANDILRAEKAKNEQLKELNRQQFGEQTSFIEKIKKNWLAASAAIVAGLMTIRKAMKFVDMGAEAQRSEAAFRIIAENSGMAADTVIKNMDRATKGVLNMSGMMQKAIKLIAFDYTAEQIERFSGVIETAAIISGQRMTDTFDRLADAIGSRMPRAMYEMGAVTREQMDVVQRAITAGAEATIFFEVAMANLELQQLRLQGTQAEAVIQLEKYRNKWDEFGEFIGVKLIKIFGWLVKKTYEAIETFYLFEAATAKLYKNIYKLGAEVNEFLGFDKLAEDLRNKAATMNAMYNLSIADAERYRKKIIDLTEPKEKATKKEIEEAKKRVDALIAELERYIEARKNANKEHKKDIDKKTELYEGEKKKFKDYTAEIERLWARWIQSHVYGYVEIARSANSTYEKSTYYADKAFKFQLEQFKLMKKDMMGLGWTEEEWQDWYNAKAFEAQIQSQKILLQGLKNIMKYSNDTKIGVQTYFKEMELNIYTWSQATYDNIKNFASSAKSTLSEVFFDASSRDLKHFSDYWLSFMNSIKKKWFDTIAEMIIQWVLFQSKINIFKLFGSLFAGIGGGGGAAAAAQGMIFDAGKIKQFQKGGIVSTPTYFPIGLMGEKGPEAILPLKRTKSGNLGVESTGPTLSVSVPITINGGFNKKMVNDLKTDIEDLVERKVRAWV